MATTLPGVTDAGTSPRDNPQTEYDSQKDLFFFTAPGGQRVYIPPVNYKGQAQGSGHGMIQNQGGAFKSPDQFNALTGEIDKGGTDWLAVAQLVAAGAITAGFATGVLGAPAATIAEAGSAGSATGAGLGGMEAGAVSGVSPVVASGSLAGGAGAGLGTAGAAADASAFDAAGNFIGPSSVTGATGGSTLGTIGSILGKTAGTLGPAIGSATSAAGNNALTQEQLGLTANQQNISGEQAYQNELDAQARLGLDANSQNISGQSAFESELLNRAKTEASQRDSARADIYRSSAATTPRVSPFNPAGPTQYSPAYLEALSNLQTQGSSKLAAPAQYDTTKMAPLAPYVPYKNPAMPAPTPYTPIPPNNVQGATGTKPGTLQTVGNWLSPALSTYGAIAQYL